MPLTIASNTSALQTLRRLGRNTHELSKVQERLSSGLRINRAVDDAAGLAIADTLRVDTKVAQQGIRNINDGLSLTSIADGASAELSNIIIRIRELAEQSANGTLANKQRAKLDNEAQALSREYLRIARTTEFNGLHLFDGLPDGVRIQAGYAEAGSVTGNVGGKMGTGTYGAASSFDSESTVSRALVIADLNSDGFRDLVTAGTGGGGLTYSTVRLGTSDGTFTAARSYMIEAAVTHEVKLGDINSDGILDMVNGSTTAGLAGLLTVRLGLGDGTFGAARSEVVASSGPSSIGIADMNGDGAVDLVLGVTAGTGSGSLHIRLGRGDGTFGPSLSYISSEPYDVAIADVNNDGVLDAITAGSTGTDGWANVWLGVGNGTFNAALSYAAESREAFGVSLEDINGDQILDLITAGGADAGAGGYFTIRLGTGTGTFGAATSYATESSSSRDVEVVDVNGDGLLDVITTGQSAATTGISTVRLGNGDGSFRSPLSYASEPLLSSALALDDLNSDGVLDLITAGGTGSSGRMIVRYGETTAGLGGLLPFSLRTMIDARQAMPIFENAQRNLLVQRGSLGAFESRLSTAANVVRITAENYTSAEAQLREADVANESALLVKHNIMQQAAAAVLAQANVQPELALTLL